MKMKFSIIVFFCLFLSFCVISCSKKEKVGKVEIVDVQFIMDNDDSQMSGSLNVRGIVKNTSSFDVKKVVITGSCDSCMEIMTGGNWFSTKDKNFKSGDQSDVISYISAGNTEPFEFKGIAYWFKTASKPVPDHDPEGLKVVVESFETVQN